jgi:hypothetical protein
MEKNVLVLKNVKKKKKKNVTVHAKMENVHVIKKQQMEKNVLVLKNVKKKKKKNVIANVVHKVITTYKLLGKCTCKKATVNGEKCVCKQDCTRCLVKFI